MSEGNEVTLLAKKTPIDGNAENWMVKISGLTHEEEKEFLEGCSSMNFTRRYNGPCDSYVYGNRETQSSALDLANICLDRITGFKYSLKGSERNAEEATWKFS